MLSLQQMIDQAAGEITRWSPERANVVVGTGGLLIDIRDQVNRERDGVVPGSLSMPRTVLEWRVAFDSPWRNPHLSGLDQQLILICDHGYSSVLAAQSLRRLGFRDAGDVIGGFAAWTLAGLPVTVPAAPDPCRLPGMSGPE